ncbi:MAG: universal stress protein [Ornithinibacter sp.]
MSGEQVAFVIVAWIAIGLATGLWMARRGHDWRWTLIAVVLGPLFVPIAWERVVRRPRVAASSGDGPPEPRGRASGPRVLVGIDGSPDAERALDTAMDLMGPRCALVVLAEVVTYDATDTESPDAVEAATRHVERAALRLPGMNVNREVLAGPPGEALRQYAADHDLDVVVVGRRGRGLSERLLGSVSEDLLRHSDVSVLVVEPRSPQHRPGGR